MSALQTKVIQQTLVKREGATKPEPLVITGKVQRAPVLPLSEDIYNYNRDRVNGGWERLNTRTQKVERIKYAVIANPTFGTEEIRRQSGCGSVGEIVGRVTGRETSSAALAGITNLQKLSYQKGSQDPFGENGQAIKNAKLVVLTNDGIGLVSA